MKLRETSIFILAEEEDMGFAVSAIKANAWKYILIRTVDTYIWAITYMVWNYFSKLNL